MARILLILALMLGMATQAHAEDDVARAGRGVVRIIAGVEYLDGSSNVALGSGFAISPTRVITNYHVVENYDRYAGQAEDSILAVVPSQGSRPFPAQLLRVNAAKDLAMLELVDGSVPALRIFGGAAAPGLTVTALGYPSNVDYASAQSVRDFVTPTPFTRSSGEISASRIMAGNDAYLHDAQMAHGNSGGPLVDRCGRVVGVNNAITGGQGHDATFGFAISNRELLTFLGSVGVPTLPETGNCITSEERERQRLEQVSAAASQARGLCERRNQALRERTERERLKAEKSARKRSENMFFGAIALLVVGGLCLGAAGMLFGQQKKPPAIIAAFGGAALLIGAVGLFMNREAVELASPTPAFEDCNAAAAKRGSAVDPSAIIRANGAEADQTERSKTSNTTGM